MEKVIAILTLLIVSLNSYAFEVLSLDKVDITYRSYFPGGRVLLINNNTLPNKSPASYLGLGVNMNVFEVFRWDNTIHSYVDKDSVNGSSQFRTISWEFSIYISPMDFIDLGLYHHSQHVLDMNNKFAFPVEDAFFLHINVYKSKTKRESML